VSNTGKQPFPELGHSFRPRFREHIDKEATLQFTAGEKSANARQTKHKNNNQLRDFRI
jgi:hypothetical protein